jgi:hypothetical protein
MTITSLHSPFRGYRTSDGRIFTAVAVHPENQRQNVTVCATDEDAKAFAEAHQQTLEQQ